MTWVDLVVLGVLALSGLLACMRGFVREVLSIGAWVGAVMIAWAGLPWGETVAAQWIHDRTAAEAASFVAIGLVSLVVLKLVAKSIGKLVDGIGLGSVDRTLGLVFGLARGVILVMVAYILAGKLMSPQFWPEPVHNALSRPWICEAAHRAMEYLPADKDEKGDYKYRPTLPESDCGQKITAADLSQVPPQGRATGR
jgi:membrane protein required for colicin V production